MFEIKKAIVRIDTEEYAEDFKKFPGYVDAAQNAREPNEEFVCGEYASLEETEQEVDRTLTLDITDSEVTIKYEYISGAEDIYFNKVRFDDHEYDLETDFFVRDQTFCDAVEEKLKELDL